jgi:hypothetical protein
LSRRTPVVRKPIVFDLKNKRVYRASGRLSTDDLGQAMRDAVSKVTRRGGKTVKTVEGVPPQVRHPKA